MFMEVKTIITSQVPITDDGFGTPEHSVDIQAGDLGRVSVDLAYAVVIGACHATLNSLEKRVPHLTDDDTDEAVDIEAESGD